MRTVGSVFVVVVCLLVVGCRPEDRTVAITPAVTPEPQLPQVSTEQQQLLEEILDYTKQTGSTLEQLAEEARRREALEQAPRGVTAIDDDLQVAKALVAAARSAATSREAEPTAARLHRLHPTVGALRAELPAAAIAQHLERALVAINNLPAQDAANAASASLLAAIDTAMQAPAPLVPEVVKAVERAKTSVDQQRLEDAGPQMLEILKQLRADTTVRMLDGLVAGARGAEEALNRRAWPVVVAELDQLDVMLGELQEKVGVTTTVIEQPEEEAEAEEAVEAEEAEEAEPAEPVESAEPEEPAGREAQVREGSGSAPPPTASPAPGRGRRSRGGR